MCLDFVMTTNTHSASAIASTEKENFPFAHVHVKGFRSSTGCLWICLTQKFILLAYKNTLRKMNAPEVVSSL